MYTKRQFFFLLKVFISVITISFSSLYSWIDLEKELMADFIIENKKIKIPGYPDAFNPSIMRWKGSLLMSFRTGDFNLASDSEEEPYSLLMSFRIRDPLDALTNEIGLVLMDQDFNIISTPQVLYVPRKDPHLAFRQQDPRLIAVKDKIYLVFCNMIEGFQVPEIRRMFITELHYDGRYFYVDEPECLAHFDGENESRWQKNWVPFDYKGQLMLSYSIMPHRVVCPIIGTGACPTFDYTNAKSDWQWGVLRGGTPALQVDGEYLSFFHSSLVIPTEQSQGKKIQHYFMGAYTFASKPPFHITKISPQPIVGEKFYNGPAHQTWKPLRVVFPAGFIFDDKFVWVAYGRQDHEIWISKMDKQGLMNSLLPVSSQ
ncbi:MAG: hypothetical protein JHC93_01300 [Parachlamydiales bacterium]|nr:hypothetical protein [Parachlamydiales bacterium]